jgi:hypothetical protein
LPFFIDFLKQADLFDPWVADCPLYLSSPNAPRKRDLLGTVMLSVLAGHRRYAHVAALRCDPVNPPLLGMSKVVSEDSVRRNLEKIADEPGRVWLQNHLDYCTAPLLGEPWILDVDSTVKPLYGHQEGAKAGYNPRKPGRPSHSYHTYMLANWSLPLRRRGTGIACRCAARRRIQREARDGGLVGPGGPPGSRPPSGVTARR